MALSCSMSGSNQSQEQVTREWDDMASEWDDVAAVFAQSLYAHLCSHRLWPDANAVPTVRIMDFGCGTGLLTERLVQHYQSRHVPGVEILAVDASPRMIRILNEKVRDREWTHITAVTLVLGECTSGKDTERMKEWYGTVDFVVASNVLTCIPQSHRTATLDELARFLNPNGGIVCHADWCTASTKDSDANPVPWSQHTMTRHQAEQVWQDHSNIWQPVSLTVASLAVTHRRNDPLARMWIGVVRVKKNVEPIDSCV